MKQITFIYFFTLITQVSFTQNIVGKVYDTQKKPVEFANVVIYRQEQIISFTNTDEKGLFFLEQLPCDSLQIKISLIDYKTEIIELSPCQHQDTLKILLVEESTAIEAIIVRAKKDVVVLKDTTEYDVDSFRDGTEKNMEDLLRKLPGVEVDEKGKIKYFNKPIEKITIDGDDLTGRNYELVSRSMPTRIAEKVQVIERFNENKLLKNIANSQAVILNFQVRKEYKYSVFGRTGLGLGSRQRQDYDANFTVISPKFKLLTKTSYNNIGLFSAYIEDIAEGNAQKNTFNPAEHFYLLKNDLQPILKHRLQGATPILGQVSLLNDEKTASGHFVAKPNAKMQITGGLLWGQDKNILSNQFQTEYLNLPEPFTFKATDLAQNQPNLWGGNLKFYADLDDKTNLLVHTEFLGRKTAQSYLSVGNFNTFKTDAQNLFHKLDNQAILTKKIDSLRAITLQIEFQERESNEKWTLQATNPLQSPTSDLIDEPILQNIYANTQFFSIKSTYYQQKHFFKYAFGLAQKQKYNLWDIAIKNFVPDSTLQSRYSFTEAYSHIFANFNYVYRKWAFSNFSEAGILSNNLASYRKSLFQHKSSISKMVSWGNVETTYQYALLLPEFSEWSDAAFYTDYRFFSQGSGRFNPAQTHELKTNFIFQKPYHLPYATISVGYQLRQKGYFLANRANANLLVGQWLPNENFNFQNVLFSAQTSRFVSSLLLNFNFEPTFSYRTFQSLVENVVFTNRATLYQLKVGIGSGFSGRFNFSSEWTGSRNRINDLIFSNLQASVACRYRFSPSFYVRFSNDFWGIWQERQANYSFFGKVEVHKTWKKIEFSLICHNLYNARSYQRQWNSEFFRSTNEVLLLPRYVMMKIGFNF